MKFTYLFYVTDLFINCIASHLQLLFFISDYFYLIFVYSN